MAFRIRLDSRESLQSAVLLCRLIGLLLAEMGVCACALSGSSNADAEAQVVSLGLGTVATGFAYFGIAQGMREPRRTAMLSAIVLNVLSLCGNARIVHRYVTAIDTLGAFDLLFVGVAAVILGYQLLLMFELLSALPALRPRRIWQRAVQLDVMRYIARIPPRPAHE